ncbi:MAG: SdpI family protein [Oscillospiraceae bacterium]
MKKLTKNMLLTTIVALLPMALGIALYNKLPAQLPTHWNISGEVNDYSSKAFVVFGLPAFMSVMGLFVQFMLEQDPKKANMSPVLKMISRWICPVMSLILVPVTLFIGMGYDNIPIPLIVNLLVGIIFIVIGNYLPKSKQSYTMGIRLPWTLNSEENWNRTHRLAGKLWMLGGFLFILCGFAAQYIQSQLMTTVTIGGIMVMVFIPMIYSFLLYKKGI